MGPGHPFKIHFWAELAARQMTRHNAGPKPAAAAAAGAAPATTAAAAAPVAGCRLAALAPLVPPARWEFCRQGAPRFHSAGQPILSPRKIPITIPRDFQCARAGRLDASLRRRGRAGVRNRRVSARSVVQRIRPGPAGGRGP